MYSGQREDRHRHADGEEDDRRDDQRQDEAALVRVQSWAHEPPDLLDHDRRRDHEPDVQRDLELE